MLRALLPVALVLALSLAAPQAALAEELVPADSTACAASASDYVPVYSLDLPERANWRNQAVPYTFDRTAEVAGGFDRVGYCLELTGPTGTQWVWTSMLPFTTDATRLGLPTADGQIVRQRVGGLEVASNVEGVSTGEGLTGYLEMWPGSYTAAVSAQVSGASPTLYDADDTPSATGGYGSFQVHQVSATRPSAETAKTVLAVNTFTRVNEPLSVGIGSAPTGHPDWTFAGNAAAYSRRRLTAYARPSRLTLTEQPQDRRLYPRDASNGANVPVSGEVTDHRVRAVQLRVTSGEDERVHTEPVNQRRTFSFAPRIEAGLREYRFELRTLGDGPPRVVTAWDGLVAGDVYVIQGQSNAVSGNYNGTAAAEASPWVRSYGSPHADPVLSRTARGWNYGISEATSQPGSIGQWGLRMARKIVDTHGVPVAVLNGAHSGRPIDFFQRDEADPGNLLTNYGRLRGRLDAAGVASAVRGVLWYQGESDSDNVPVHVGGFTALLEDWRADLPGAEYFVYQVRTSPCSNTTNTALRDAQRLMGDTLGVTVLSTTGLNGHDGCHYAWEQGYREMGDHAFAVVSRDLYGGPAEGVSPPNPAGAAFSGPGRTEITVRLRTDDPLTVEPGAQADFRVDGAAVTVTGVEYRDGSLVLSLSGPADGATGVSYRGHLRAGPRVLNATGAGLLAFHQVPLAP
ncbi:sialate O-acetylesterase [Nonomuraea sp. NBC_01738]|uniref:sialate O-acetylesterase n=1 Tax=Nonomuraea sp. NBC_01738 TaxID=2976003 RepID=UPI002E1280DC|nr:sialate O-acetylesterase [Nonomuraea sp. NBC_01738]